METKQPPTEKTPSAPGAAAPSAERPAPSSPRITPLATKIGEGPGNLRRREEWFRRRTGNPR